MIGFSYYFTRIQELFFRSFHIIKFIKTNRGIKNVNASLLVEQQVDPIKEVTLHSSSLFLGPDFLKDKYTLLDCCIEDSPHFGLVSALMNEMPIMETEYIHRLLNGTLDWRSPLILPKDKDYFRNKYNRALLDIYSGAYKPIVVYFQGGKYYIYDGKHRAALCALLGKDIRCKVVGSGIANSNIWNYMFSIIKNDKAYSRHTKYHNIYLNESI